MCYRRGNRSPWRKPLYHPPSGNQSTRQSVGIHELARDPPSLIYRCTKALQAPTPTRLLGTVSCLALRIPQQAPCCICHSWLLLMLPSRTKTSLNTLKGCGKCLAINLSMVWKWRGRSWGKSTNKCVEICEYNNL